MLEIEMKFPVPDFQAIEQRLRSWGASPESPLQEADHYFKAPDRDFAKTDEALRVRRIGTKNRVTYKGPRQPGPAKTRTEIEVGLADGAAAAEDFCRLLVCLGYRPTAVVRKQRIIYRLQRGGFDLEICLDQVEKLGRFVEVEIVAPEEKLAAAQQVLQSVAGELGLANSERRSYLEMLLESLEKKQQSSG
jgi:adenylate cyclase, class 2